MSLYFLITSSTIRTQTKKTVKSVVGGQERVDVISRCLFNLYRWQKRMEREIHFVLYLSHPNELSVLYIPISSIKSELKSELDSVKEFLSILLNPLEYNLKFEKVSFLELLEGLSENNVFYYFTPEGNKIQKHEKAFKKEESICFVLGSQHDLTEEHENLLFKFNTSTISLGDKNYLASHVITIACYYLSQLLG